MIKSLTNNPILLHQMRHARWPSLRTAAWIAAGLTVVGSALSILPLLIDPISGPELPLMIFVLAAAIILMFFTPILMVVVTVVVTSQNTAAESFQMLRLSQISGRDIVNAFFAGVLFRLRSLWMIVGGLILPAFVFMTRIAVVDRYQYFLAQCKPVVRDCPPTRLFLLILEGGIMALVITILYVVLLIAGNWFAAALGVWMGFRYRRIAAPAMVISIFILAVLTAFQFVALIVAFSGCLGPIIMVFMLALIYIKAGEAILYEVERSVRDETT